jgi:hypothetical protein
MAAAWSDVEALVMHLFEQGMQPDRQELVDLLSTRSIR